MKPAKRRDFHLGDILLPLSPGRVTGRVRRASASAWQRPFRFVSRQELELIEGLLQLPDQLGVVSR